MPQLRYRSDIYIDATNTSQIQRFADALRNAVVADDIQMETTELRFVPEQDTIRAGVGARIDFDKNTTESEAQERFAQVLVENGIESDVDTAKVKMRARGPQDPDISRSQVDAPETEPDPTTDTQTVQLQGPEGIQVTRKATETDEIIYQVTKNGEPTSKATVTVTSDMEYAGTGDYRPDANGEVTLPEPSKDVEITITATEA